MEAICVKLDENVMKNMDKNIKEFNYSTRTDFIREAIRDKLRELQKERVIEQLRKFKGSAKFQTTDEQREKIREEVGREYAKKFGIKLD